MGIEYIIGVLVSLVFLALIILSKNPGDILNRLKTVNTAEVLDALSTGVVVATKTLPLTLSLTDESTRKYLLAIWYWYAFTGRQSLSEEHSQAFKDAWLELDSELQLEAANAYHRLTAEHRTLLDTQITSILRRKKVDVEMLKEVLCKISNYGEYMAHCRCETKAS